MSGADTLKPAQRLWRWALGHGFIRLDELLFDYLFYPFMLLKGGSALIALVQPGLAGEALRNAGYWTGFSVAFALSIMMNVAYVVAYDRMRTDWFGLEAVRDWASRVRAIPPLLRPFLGGAAFVYLSIWHNPLFATLAVRRSNSYEMGRSDWAVFAAAVVSANVGWTALVSGAALLVRL